MTATASDSAQPLQWRSRNNRADGGIAKRIAGRNPRKQALQVGEEPGRPGDGPRQPEHAGSAGLPEERPAGDDGGPERGERPAHGGGERGLARRAEGGEDAEAPERGRGGPEPAGAEPGGPEGVREFLATVLGSGPPVGRGPASHRRGRARGPHGMEAVPGGGEPRSATRRGPPRDGLPAPEEPAGLEFGEDRGGPPGHAPGSRAGASRGQGSGPRPGRRSAGGGDGRPRCLGLASLRTPAWVPYRAQPRESRSRVSPASRARHPAQSASTVWGTGGAVNRRTNRGTVAGLGSRRRPTSCATRRAPASPPAQTASRLCAGGVAFGEGTATGRTAGRFPARPMRSAKATQRARPRRAPAWPCPGSRLPSAHSREDAPPASFCPSSARVFGRAPAPEPRSPGKTLRFYLQRWGSIHPVGRQERGLLQGGEGALALLEEQNVLQMSQVWAGPRSVIPADAGIQEISS
jgi:hypothetical protein